MGLLSTITSIFAPLPEGAIRYKGYTITAAPEEDFGRFRVNAVIRKKGKQRNYTLIDRLGDKDTCVALTHTKAKGLIDLKGEKVFL